MDAENVEEIVVTGDVAPRVHDVAGGDLVLCTRPAPHRGASEPNEDACGAIVGNDWGVFIVADGVGGHASGDRASRLAVDAVITHVRQACEAGRERRDGILDGIEAANSDVRSLAVGAGTTLVIVELATGSARSVHVGDSACAIVGQRGRIRHWTIDHSPTGHGLEAGLLDQDDAMHHDDRHILCNAVGAEDMRIDLGPPVRLAGRDTILLASDGVLDNLTRDEIIELVRSGPLEQVAQELDTRCATRMSQAAPGEPSKPDDATFILWRRRSEGRKA